MEGMHSLNYNPAVPCPGSLAVASAAGLLSGHRVELDLDLEGQRREAAASPWRRCLCVAAGVLPGVAVHASGIVLVLHDTSTAIAGMTLCGVGAVAMMALPALFCYRPRFSSWQEAEAARDNHGGAAAAGV